MPVFKPRPLSVFGARICRQHYKWPKSSTLSSSFCAIVVANYQPGKWTAVWIPTECVLNRGFCIISIAKWHETKGNRIEPSPCNAGIMVRLWGLSAAPCAALHSVERICMQRKRGRSLHPFTSACSQSPCCSGTPNMPVENGKLPATDRGKNMDRVVRPLSGSSCQSPVVPTVCPPPLSFFLCCTVCPDLGPLWVSQCFSC